MLSGIPVPVNTIPGSICAPAISSALRIRSFIDPTIFTITLLFPATILLTVKTLLFNEEVIVALLICVIYVPEANAVGAVDENTS